MVVKINRAPVLTLWAAIVAERLGFDEDESLTLGRALAGYTAQSKGQLLGIYHPRPGEASEEPAETPDELVFVSLMGRSLPALMTPHGVRAAEKGKPSDPEKVRRYLEGKFGDGLAPSQKAMRALAASFSPSLLDTEAYGLYERFRPKVEKGKAGWGSEGELDPDKIAAMARTA